MLFRKDIEPRCVYCTHSFRIDEQYCACRRNGVVDGGYRCRKFKYDPLKRIPPRPAKLKNNFSDADFSLE